MNQNLERLKQEVIIGINNPDFIHNKWFLKYHLEIVERIVLELLDRYPEANIDLLLGLVWIHDYPKIIDVKDEGDAIEKSAELLRQIGFEDIYIKELIPLLKTLESKMSIDLTEAPIEVRIMSTADAVSHMYGPFFQIYWYENSDMSVEELLESNIKKLEKDWNRKIVLPEVKNLLQERHKFLRESFGEIPDNFF